MTAQVYNFHISVHRNVLIACCVALIVIAVAAVIFIFQKRD